MKRPTILLLVIAGSQISAGEEPAVGRPSHPLAGKPISVGTAPRQSAPAAARPTKAVSSGAMALPPGHFPLDRRDRAPHVGELDLADLLEGLADFQWVAALAKETDPLQPSMPYRHPAVATLVDRAKTSPSARRTIIAELRRLLTPRRSMPLSRERVDPPREERRRLNAAVALALLDDGLGLGLLDRRLRDPSLPHVERAVCAYSLSRFPDALAPESLRELARRISMDFESEADSPSLTDEQASMAPQKRPGGELLSAIYWAIIAAESPRATFDPRRDEIVSQASKLGVESGRRAAAVAFASRPFEEIPPILDRLLRDDAAVVRRAALAALARQPTAAGRAKVLAATQDRDRAVRATAIQSLTSFPSPETTKRLKELALEESPADRADAVEAAGRLQLADLVLAGADDPSDRVRAAAARSLATLNHDDAAQALATLVGDRSILSQSAALSALGRRPLEEAVPILLTALAAPGLKTREQACRELARRWPAARDFPFRDRPEVRAQRLKELHERWQSREQPTQSFAADDALPPQDRQTIERCTLRWYAVDASPAPSKNGAESASAPAAPSGLAKKSAERHALAKQLIAYGPNAIPAIEETLIKADSFPDDSLIDEVLSKLDSIYARLSEIRRSSREGQPLLMGSLSRQMKNRRLTKGQAIVLSEHLRGIDRSTDWISLLPLIERDHPEEAARLDRLALAHHDPLVRQSACERIGARKAPDHRDQVYALVDDQHPGVRRAALAAVGKSAPSPAALDTLKRALRTPEARDRLAAASSLFALGAPEGLAELTRLAQHPDSTIRRAVIATLSAPPHVEPARSDSPATPAVDARSLSPRDVTRLLVTALGDEKVEVRRDAIVGLEKVTGASFARDTAGQRAPLDEQISRWRRALADSESSSTPPILPRPLLGN